MDLKNLSRADLFKPESFLLFYLIFIGITIASFFTDLPLKRPSLLSFAVIFATFPFFLLGVKIGKNIYGKKVPKIITGLFLALVPIFYALVFANFYRMSIHLPIIICATAFYSLHILLLKKMDTITLSKSVPIFLMALGIVFLLFSFFQEGGIPLLNPPLRVNFLYSTSFGIAMLIFILGFALLMPQIKDKKIFLILLILGTFLFGLTTLRGSTLTIFLAGVFTAYYAKKFDNKKVFIALITALLIILFLGYLARPILNPGNLFLYRAGTTHIVFDNIVQKSMPFGYTRGNLFFQGNPRDFVGSEIMGKQANLTYTILGAAVLDFGIIGAVLWMVFLGIILQLAYSSMKVKGFRGFYPLLFSLSLIFIEIGVDQFFLLFFWIFLLLYLSQKR